MRKRLFAVVVVWMFSLLVILVPVSAKNDVVYSGFSMGLGQGVGYSKLDMALSSSDNLQIKVVGGFSLTSHVEMSLFFVPYVGLGVGFNASRYSSLVKVRGSQSWDDVSDFPEGGGDGERYRHILSIDDWKERDVLLVLDIPVSLKFAIPVSTLAIIGEVGVSFGVLSSFSYKGSGTVSHSGYYDRWDVTMFNQPLYGFYTERSYRPSGKVKDWDNPIMGFAKLGVALPVAKNLSVTAQIYGQYGIKTMETRYLQRSSTEIGFRYDRSGMESVHYFMGDYRPVIQTKYTKGTIRPISFGIEVGIRYMVPFKNRKRYPCRCLG